MNKGEVSSHLAYCSKCRYSGYVDIPRESEIEVVPLGVGYCVRALFPCPKCGNRINVDWY